MHSMLLLHTHFTLFAVQIELVLTYCHHPDGFDQRVACIPRVDDLTRLTKCASRGGLSVDKNMLGSICIVFKTLNISNKNVYSFVESRNLEVLPI